MQVYVHPDMRATAIGVKKVLSIQDPFVKEEPSTAGPASAVPTAPAHHTAPAGALPALGVSDGDTAGANSAPAQQQAANGASHPSAPESKPAGSKFAAHAAAESANGSRGPPEAAGNATGEYNFKNRTFS